jgi:hypothetical protein
MWHYPMCRHYPMCCPVFLSWCSLHHITFKVEEKVLFHNAREGQQCFGGQKNHFSALVWLAGPQILVHSWVRYMCAKSHIHQRCGRLPKKLFSTKAYAEIHIQRPFFDNKNNIWKILGLKIQTVETCSSASSTHWNFYFWKLLKSWFLAEFLSFIFGQILVNFGNFGQFWADLGRFSYIHSGWEHVRTWAEIFKTP